MEKGAVGLVLRVAFHKLLKDSQTLKQAVSRAVCPKEIPLQLLGGDFPPKKSFCKMFLVDI